MNALKPITLVIALGASGAALAADDCRRPMAEWQPREAVTARATELGLTTERLRIDDGCYEVRGRDAKGRVFKAKLDPRTLETVNMKRRDREHERERARISAGDASGAATPIVKPGTQPRATID